LARYKGKMALPRYKGKMPSLRYKGRHVTRAGWPCHSRGRSCTDYSEVLVLRAAETNLTSLPKALERFSSKRGWPYEGAISMMSFPWWVCGSTKVFSGTLLPSILIAHVRITAALTGTSSSGTSMGVRNKVVGHVTISGGSSTSSLASPARSCERARMTVRLYGSVRALSERTGPLGWESASDRVMG